MTFFSTNRKEVSEPRTDFEPVDEGQYEVVISSVEKTTFSTGSEGLKLVYTIRSDVEQDFGNRKLFDNLVASEKAMWRWNDIGAATNVPDGVSFATAEDVINYYGKHLMGQPLVVNVKHENYQGRIQERVNAFYNTGLGGGQASNAFDASQYSNQDPFAEDGKPIDISDDDLPF